MICPNCRHQVLDGLKFCSVCGSVLNAEPAPQSPYHAPQDAYRPVNTAPQQQWSAGPAPYQGNPEGNYPPQDYGAAPGGYPYPPRQKMPFPVLLKWVCVGLAAAATLFFLLSLIGISSSFSSIFGTIIVCLAGAALFLPAMTASDPRSLLPLVPIGLLLLRHLAAGMPFSGGYSYIYSTYWLFAYFSLIPVLLLHLRGRGKLASLIKADKQAGSFLILVEFFVCSLNALLGLIQFFMSFRSRVGYVFYTLGSFFFWAALALWYFSSGKISFSFSRGKAVSGAPSVTPIRVILYALAGVGAVLGTVFLATTGNAVLGSTAGGSIIQLLSRVLHNFAYLFMLAIALIFELGGLFFLWAARKLGARDASFTAFEGFGLFCLLAGVLGFVLGDSGLGSFLTGTLLSLAVCAGIYFLTRLNFTSRNLRAYMGSDEYLRASSLTENFVP